MKLSSYQTRKYVIVSVFSILMFALIGAFAIRGVILRKAIVSINSRISRYQMVTHWDEPGFRGPGTVFVKGIYIQNNNSENEVYIDSITIKVRLAPLILGRIRFKKIDCRSVSVRYFSDSLDSGKKIEPHDSDTSSGFFIRENLADFANKNIRRFFNYTPPRLNFGRIEVRYNYKRNRSTLEIKDFRLIHGKMTAMIYLSDDRSISGLSFTGKLDKSSSIIEMNLYHADTLLLPVPLLHDKYGIAGGFDSLQFMVDLSLRSRHMTSALGKFNFSGFELKGDRLSTESIQVEQFKSVFKINLSNDFMEIDSSTIAWLNRIRLVPYAKISLNKGPGIIFRLLPETWKAKDFFNSLPSGMFTSLVGLKAEGSLNYYLNFSVNLQEPDSLKFETRLTGENFNILEYGADDYRSLNHTFQHRVYERGRLTASFQVGPENPDFVNLENISPFVRGAVMTSEDGSFYYHNGFNPNAFRESIAANIKEKRFARGGSTISMQLIKNVFLTRNKTLARKIEEALIVWMIETKNLVSKQRMYEVYLNIIEWGPGVYGISQASRFYFDKKPADLNLQESVYLASIVPHPKWYKYSFVDNGVLRPFYGPYFNRMKDLMVRKEFITAFDTLGVKPEILLKGNAARVFSTSDSVVVDSINIEDLDIIPVF